MGGGGTEVIESHHVSTLNLIDLSVTFRALASTFSLAPEERKI